MTPENPTISPVSASVPRRKPSVRFLLAHPAHFLALGFGSGLSPIMPGTVGTLLGWLMFHQFSARWPGVFTPWVWGLMIVLGFVLGIWACERTGRALGVADHGGMVWDEIIAIWLVLLLVTPCSLGMEAVAFLLFRFFDMSKPPPIGNFERRFKNGFGVMGDDILAAFFTLLAIALWPYL